MQFKDKQSFEINSFERALLSRCASIVSLEDASMSDSSCPLSLSLRRNAQVAFATMLFLDSDNRTSHLMCLMRMLERIDFDRSQIEKLNKNAEIVFDPDKPLDFNLLINRLEDMLVDRTEVKLIRSQSGVRMYKPYDNNEIPIRELQVNKSEIENNSGDRFNIYIKKSQSGEITVTSIEFFFPCLYKYGSDVQNYSYSSSIRRNLSEQGVSIREFNSTSGDHPFDFEDERTLFEKFTMAKSLHHIHDWGGSEHQVVCKFSTLEEAKSFIILILKSVNESPRSTFYKTFD